MQQVVLRHRQASTDSGPRAQMRASAALGQARPDHQHVRHASLVARTGRSKFTMVRHAGLQLSFLVMIQALVGFLVALLSSAYPLRRPAVLTTGPSANHDPGYGNLANLGRDRSIRANLPPPATDDSLSTGQTLQKYLQGALAKLTLRSNLSLRAPLLCCLIIRTTLAALSLSPSLLSSLSQPSPA